MPSTRRKAGRSGGTIDVGWTGRLVHARPTGISADSSISSSHGLRHDGRSMFRPSTRGGFRTRSRRRHGERLAVEFVDIIPKLNDARIVDPHRIIDEVERNRQLKINANVASGGDGKPVFNSIKRDPRTPALTWIKARDSRPAETLFDTQTSRAKK